MVLSSRDASSWRGRFGGSAGNQVDLGEAMVASAFELLRESFHLCTLSRVEVKLTLQDR